VIVGLAMRLSAAQKTDQTDKINTGKSSSA
jgi:hypothetical protein